MDGTRKDHPSEVIQTPKDMRGVDSLITGYYPKKYKTHMINPIRVGCFNPTQNGEENNHQRQRKGGSGRGKGRRIRYQERGLEDQENEWKYAEVWGRRTRVAFRTQCGWP